MKNKHMDINLKKLLIFPLTLFLFVSCSEEFPEDRLVERNGMKYEVNSQTPFSGTSVNYYEDGQLNFRKNYKDGQRDVLTEWYYENGQLEMRGNYKDGDLDGSYESYYEDGQLKEKKTYTNGELDGSLQEYFWNGQLIFKGTYKDGDLDGPYESYYGNGQLKEKGTSIKGDGSGKMYYENGEIWYQLETNKDGELESSRCFENGDSIDMSYCD
jgi:antitoxin component YwqK of YwqJK toxin-antitoxin module